MRRGLLAIRAPMLCAVLFGATLAQAEAPTQLTVELLRMPQRAVITDSVPEFSWVIPQSNRYQSAYQIVVSSAESFSDELWNSGKLSSSSNLNIPYAGEPLEDNRSYWWQVRVWDERGEPSEMSIPQRFNTGLLDISRREPRLSWPQESLFVQLESGEWVSENRQTASFESIAPQAFERVANNHYMADFGKAAFATLALDIEAQQDANIRVFLGERVDDSGLVDKEPGRSNIGYEVVELAIRAGSHSYELVIPPHESRSPHTQKLAPFYPEVVPFRFVEIDTNGEDIIVSNLLQQALFYPFDDRASYFESDNGDLNKVWELSKYTLKATPFLGLYSDGNRERMPYEADAFIQQLGHYSVDREFSVARYSADFLMHHASWPTEWQMHVLFMAWYDYLHTGNKDLLARHYDALKHKTLVALARPDGLISTREGRVTQALLNDLRFNGSLADFRDIVDWPAGTAPGEVQRSNRSPLPGGERDNYVFTDYNTVVNAFHYRALVLMAEIAAAMGVEADARIFTERAERVRASIMTHMFDATRGIFVDGIGTEHAALHANMFPLAFGLVPEEHMESVVEYVKSRGMASSVYGAQFLLEGLFNAGEAEYALSLLTSDGQRSWLNMLAVGASMTTEAWDEYYKPNLTWNHAWGSSPANLIPRKLMGIEPLTPGFRSFRVVPQPGGLNHAELILPTINGSIETELTVSDNRWTLSLHVPANSHADLWLPTDFESVTIEGERVTGIEEQLIVNGMRERFRLGAGTYLVEAQ